MGAAVSEAHEHTTRSELVEARSGTRRECEPRGATARGENLHVRVVRGVSEPERVAGCVRARTQLDLAEYS